MKIVKTSEKYMIYGDDLITDVKLPSKILTVGFNMDNGFYLEDHDDIEIKEEKIYGLHFSKANKVITRFKNTNKNLGVILSGDKGIGKSLCAKLICQKAIENDIPVILIEKYYRNIESFIQSIDQTVMVLFDEFDKTFCFERDNDADPQSGLLTLFDGMASGKKLFVITCNDIYALNDCLINRPGRMHFHFRFTYPTPDEIREYLKDKLKPEYYDEINSIIDLSFKTKLNYDCLNAIVLELNTGESFKNAINDLNIINDGSCEFNLYLVLNNGEKIEKKTSDFDICDNNKNKIYFYRNHKNICIEFVPSLAIVDKNKLIIKKEDIVISQNSDISVEEEILSIGIKELIIEKRTYNIGFLL